MIVAVGCSSYATLVTSKVSHRGVFCYSLTMSKPAVRICIVEAVAMVSVNDFAVSGEGEIWSMSNI